MFHCFHWCLHVEQRQAQHPPTSTHWWQSTSPPEVWEPLVSDASCTITERLRITFQNILVHCSWLVEWSSYTYPERWIPVNLQATTENSSLSTLLDWKKTSSFSLSFSPSLASLYLFEQCLRLGVTSTSSASLPLQDESLHVFPNVKSLWIKASAKWLNVNMYIYIFIQI